MKMSKGHGKASSSHVGLDSGLCCHEKIHGATEGKHVSGQQGKNNVPTKTMESVSGHGRNFKIG